MEGFEGGAQGLRGVLGMVGPGSQATGEGWVWDEHVGQNQQFFRIIWNLVKPDQMHGSGN